MIYGIKEKMAGKKYSSGHILIYGGGGHAKSVIDLIRANGAYHIAGIVDDGLEVSSQVMGIPVLGGGSILDSLAEQGLELAVNAVGGIGAPEKRIAVFEKLKLSGFAFPNLIHPRLSVVKKEFSNSLLVIFVSFVVGHAIHETRHQYSRSVTMPGCGTGYLPSGPACKGAGES